MTTTADAITLPEVRYEYVAAPVTLGTDFAAECQRMTDRILASFGIPAHILRGEPPMDPRTQAFLAAIDANPADRLTWLQLADYLADRGEPEAEGWRWLVRWPGRPKNERKRFGGWTWRIVSHSWKSPVNMIPFIARAYLTGMAVPHRFVYPTASAALSDAARAVVRWKKGKVTA